MLCSLRLITTGLNDVHSVIGYEVRDSNGFIQNNLIQPRDGSEFSFEAMHDVNGISIPELIEQGATREKSLLSLVSRFVLYKEILVWYAPFVKKFITQVADELDLIIDFKVVDLYAIAKQKGINSPDFKLASVYEYMGVNNMLDLYDKLQQLPDPQRLRRL